MKRLYFYFLPLTAVAAWLLEGLVLNNFANLPIQSVFAKLFGLLGIAFLTVSFLTSSRLEIIERIFGGLDVVYKFHKLSGRFAYTFILIHPILLLTRSAIDIDSLKRYFIVGTTGSNTLNTGIIAFYILNVLIALTLVFKLPYQVWKRTHRFMILVFIFSGIHVLFGGNNVSRTYVIIMLVLGLVAYIYRQVLYGIHDRKFVYEVVKTNKLFNITEFYLKPLGKRLRFQPGQFVFMRFLDSKDIPNESHPYSISSNHIEDTIRISAKALGNFSDQLDEAKIGDKVKLVGPHGRFILNNSYKKQLWISGGIGTTPFLSMLTSVAINVNLVFIHSNKTVEEAVYTGEISSKLGPNAKLITHSSDTEGFINAEYIKNNVPDFKDRVVYVCGPAAMMYAMQSLLVELGVPKSNIKFEDFNFK